MDKRSARLEKVGKRGVPMSNFRRFIPPVAAFLLALPAVGDQLPPDASYRPLPTQPLATVRAEDEAAKPEVMRQQQQLFEQRFDLSDRPSRA